jgi:hypothetical protein
MVRRSVAIAVLAAVLAPAAPAAGEESAPQKLFRKRLLRDAAVSREVKGVLRHGGFVDRNIRFSDLTGDGKSDAVVLVNQGGAAGRIALYVYSSHETRELRVVYRNQHLYRARAKLRRAGPGRPHGSVVFRVPLYDPGDILSDPGAWRKVELRWRARRSLLRRFNTETIDNVRARYCSDDRDFCTRALKTAAGKVYLELRSISLHGRYTLCVTTPARHTDCRPFTLRRVGDEFVSRVRWTANFPDEGRGRYSVTWQLGPQRLGPPLGFRHA